jgi:ketosteroid isomerase-like protein
MTLDSNSAALETVQAYHRSWTSGDVDTAMQYIAADIVCEAPGEQLVGREAYRAYIADFAPLLTGLEDLAHFAADGQVALFYCPQTAVADTAPAAELFTVAGGRITRSVLVFDRMSFAPPQQT